MKKFLIPVSILLGIGVCATTAMAARFSPTDYFNNYLRNNVCNRGDCGDLIKREQINMKSSTDEYCYYIDANRNKKYIPGEDCKLRDNADTYARAFNIPRAGSNDQTQMILVVKQYPGNEKVVIGPKNIYYVSLRGLDILNTKFRTYINRGGR